MAGHPQNHLNYFSISGRNHHFSISQTHTHTLSLSLCFFMSLSLTHTHAHTPSLSPSSFSSHSLSFSLSLTHTQTLTHTHTQSDERQALSLTNICIWSWKLRKINFIAKFSSESHLFPVDTFTKFNWIDPNIQNSHLIITVVKKVSFFIYSSFGYQTL